jgi:hypothetical protein
MAAPRYDRDGRPIPPGPMFGAATRQTWETDEQRSERLETPDSHLDEAVAQILGEVEQAKAAYGLEDGDRIDTLEELDELVGRATWATKQAAAQVVADNPRTLADDIEAQHQQAFLAALNSDDEPETITVPEAESEPGGLRLFDETVNHRYWTNDNGDVYTVDKDPEPGVDLDLGRDGYYAADDADADEWDDEEEAA